MERYLENNKTSKQNSIAFIGNYLPRKCGIATFTTDLLEAISAESPDIDGWAVVMNDVPDGYDYPAEVRFEVNQNNFQEYRLARAFLNMNGVDVVCLQHEFGIFGGKRGSHILAMLRDLRPPLITTFHTVLQEPDPNEKAILEELGKISDKVVVMSRFAVELLKDVYNVPEEKIVFIPHGIPDTPFIDPNYYKDQFGVEGKKVILTFGLLSPGKGIEYMIEALPAVVEAHPDAVYIILGDTHPHVKRESGEEYRLSLQRRARKLKVENHILFHNRFVSFQELREFLGCAEVYVTPYLNKNQIVSGTLAYAMGTGKAVVSTPYWYAEEMLAEGRGRLVPFRDASSLAAEIISLFDNEVELNAVRKRAYKFTRQMVWKEVARKYLEVISELRHERKRKFQLAPSTLKYQTSYQELPEINFSHLQLMTDDTGVFQHARYTIPDRNYGYTTDDNARALIAVLMALDKVPEPGMLNILASRYLSFLHYAFNDNTGKFRNFMAYDRTWLEDMGSEDSHGRALMGLGSAVALSIHESMVAMALSLFDRALPAVEHLKSIRACAFSIIGIHLYRRRFGGDRNARLIEKILAERLFQKYDSPASDDWPWIEDKLTYANGKIPHALILAGSDMKRRDMVEAGLHLLDWLDKIQLDPSGHFVPIGNDGWYFRNGKRARYDQQPIEAEAMIEANVAAYNVTGEEKWVESATRCFEWYLGANDLQTPLYDYSTGGCRDGLHAEGVNQNQGAESTISWLISLITMYTLRSSRTVSVGGKAGKPLHSLVSDNPMVSSDTGR